MRFSLQIYLGVLGILLLSSPASAQEEDLVNGKYCNSLCRKWMGLPQQPPLELHRAQPKVDDYKSLTINRSLVRARPFSRPDLTRSASRLNHGPLSGNDNIDSDYFQHQPRDQNDIIPLIEARRLLLRPDVKSDDLWGLAGLKPIEEGFSTILGLSRSAFGGLVRPFFDTAAMKRVEPPADPGLGHNQPATPHQ